MKHEESKQGVTIKIYVTPDTDVDATVQRIKGVIEQVVSANADHIAVTGDLKIGNADQVELGYELAPDPEPPDPEYKFPPFGE